MHTAWGEELAPAVDAEVALCTPDTLGRGHRPDHALKTARGAVLQTIREHALTCAGIASTTRQGTNRAQRPPTGSDGQVVERYSDPVRGVVHLGVSAVKSLPILCHPLRDSEGQAGTALRKRWPGTAGTPLGLWPSCDTTARLRAGSWT
jgi:hypothetical protein